MSASLSFQDSSGTATTDLANVRVVILKDKTGSEYTLDVSGSELKLVYAPNGGGTKVEHTVGGLASALSSLLNLTDPNISTQSVLATEVAKQAVVDVLVPALAVGSDDTKKVYTQSAAKAAFATKGDVEVGSLITTLTTGSDDTKKVYTQKAVDELFEPAVLAPKVAEKTVVGAILAAEDSGKNIAQTTLLAPAVLTPKVTETTVVEGILAATKNDGSGNPVNIAQTELLAPAVLAQKVAHPRCV